MSRQSNSGSASAGGDVERQQRRRRTEETEFVDAEVVVEGDRCVSHARLVFTYISGL